MMKKKELFAALTLVMGYLLGISDGRLALWEGDDPSPRYVFAVRVDSLSPVQQSALRSGIHAPDQDALLALLQEYL